VTRSGARSNDGPRLGHDWARRVRHADKSGTITTMQRHRSTSLPALGGVDDSAVSYDARRVSRSSAVLFGLALLGATVTVLFGIWMAGVVPSASMGQPAAAPVSAS
jgi:hypothetical protein